MSTPRSTAVLEFTLPSSSPAESLPLTGEREFGVCLHIDGLERTAGLFRSPMNDAQWRDFSRWLSKCNTERDPGNYDLAQALCNFGRDLFLAIAALSGDLAQFLAQSGVSRRLVIQAARPELHQLPWGALYDPQKNALLAAGDLSIVQTWSAIHDPSGNVLEAGGFHVDAPRSFNSTVNVVVNYSSNVPGVSLEALDKLPPEVTRLKDGPLDILHLEQHGDEVHNKVGPTVAMALAETYRNAGIALLWSCFSASPNSWGESPALSLHRRNAGLVLSFQAELHIDDAGLIASSFYGEVFGPAATRDPETALVRIRAARFAKDFAFANWASMTVFLREPLDLSALPLNGPRVPSAQWQEAAAADSSTETAAAWDTVAKSVSALQPGSIKAIDASGLGDSYLLSRSLFDPWNGNVIRLDGEDHPLSTDTLQELNIPLREMQGSSNPDQLLWFFNRIAHFGSPLIVWANTQPRHLEFLRTIAPSSALTFLLLYGPQPQPTVSSLVEQDQYDQALALYMQSPPQDPEAMAEATSAAYFACARSGKPAADAEAYLAALGDSFENLLLSGNFVSRFPAVPRTPDQLAGKRPVDLKPGDPGTSVTDLQRHQIEEDFYRRAIDAATKPKLLLRERGRARHELAYCMQCQGRTGTADFLYRMALQDLDRYRPPDSAKADRRWSAALSATLRDWADLLSTNPARTAEAASLLNRALAIHTYHGRKLQIAYSLATRAQISLTSGDFDQATEDAVDSANLFEECANWRGWMSAFEVLLKALAETRQTTRMLELIHMARQKIPEDKLPAFLPNLRFEQANAHWIAGNLHGARHALYALQRGAPDGFAASELGQRAARLQKLLKVRTPGPSRRKTS
jgi:tetratricopeptide (TPR) repeat protein